MQIFETDRLILRHITIEDIDDLLAIFEDPETARYLSGTKARKATEDWIARVQKSYREHGYGPWGIILKENNEFIGYCGLYLQKNVNGQDEVEILYGIKKRYWGNGFATEAAKATYRYATSKLGIKRLISLIRPENKASRRVAEKVGMKPERETFRWNKRHLVYSIDIATPQES